MQYRTIYCKPTELYHFGIPGMKWGVRRYQNPDGSLTSAGRGRYNESTGMYTASNGVKIANANKFSVRRSMAKRANVAGLSLNNTSKAQVHREQDALREYDRYKKSIKKGQFNQQKYDKLTRKAAKKEAKLIRKQSSYAHVARKTIARAGALKVGSMLAAGYLSTRVGDQVAANLIHNLGNVAVAGSVLKGAHEATIASNTRKDTYYKQH